MWKWVKGLFGGGDKAGKAVDFATTAITGIGNWIDEKDFTPEERSKALAEAVKAHLELVKATANENSLRSVTRRWLAWGVGIFDAFWISVAMIFAIFGEQATVDRMVEVANTFYIGMITLAVFGFYFGVQLLRK